MSCSLDEDRDAVVVNRFENLDGVVVVEDDLSGWGLHQV